MAAIKEVWGPHKTTLYSNRIVWSFTGVRANGLHSKWVLTFYFDSRKFRTKHIRTEDDDRTAQLPGLARITNPMEGRVADMLRAKLKPEHIAEATRLALKHGAKP
jgi:hypothetical protein